MRVLFHVLAFLPLWLLQGLGALAGNLLWITNSSRKRVAMRNISRCMPELPPAEQRRVARLSLGHELKTYLETARLWLGPASRVRAQLREERGVDALDRAFAHGKGIVLLTLHMGAFEAGAIPMSERYPGQWYGLYKPQNKVLDELAIRGRGRFGGVMLPALGGIGRTALPLLAKNSGMYYMPDHDPPEGRGIFAPFMTQPAHTPTLVAKLVRTSGARVVFLWVERLGWARGFVAHYFDAEEAMYDADPKVATAAMNRDLERCVRACPEQYWWGYRRFRRQPAGAPSFYAEL
jgi:KDO2-lipid IV(A) lauroyltransferase